MKRFTIPTLVLAIATSMFAAPQGKDKKAPPATQTPVAADAKDAKSPAEVTKGKGKTKTKKAPKVKAPKDTNK